MAFCKLQRVDVRTKCLCTGGLKGCALAPPLASRNGFAAKRLSSSSLAMRKQFSLYVVQRQLAMLTVFKKAVML
jgi:hypothetical protein